MNVFKGLIFTLTMISFLLLGCGPSISHNNSGNRGENPDNRETISQEFITISVAVSEGNGFRLTDATSFEMALEGCLSGLAYESITSANPIVSLYKSDRNCLIKLKSFGVGGKTYVPDDENPFETWGQGEVATYKSTTDAEDKLRLRISTQLSNPVETTDSVNFAFSEVKAGDNETLTSDIVGDSHDLSVTGQAAPAFTIRSPTFHGINETGGGQFSFELECESEVNSSSAVYSCNNLSFDSIRYAFIKDTYDGSLTIGEAAALFEGASEIIATADQINVSGSSRGGFKTSVLNGPDQMHNNPNLILVLEAANQSYRYFTINIETLSYESGN